MKSIKVAIAGVGNCASSLVQGLEYYRHRKSADTAGLMHAGFSDPVAYLLTGIAAVIVAGGLVAIGINRWIELGKGP